MFFINSAKFASFSAAALCAVKHAQQRGECVVRAANGTLLADFRLANDGSVSVCATDVGKPLVEEWAA